MTVVTHKYGPMLSGIGIVINLPRDKLAKPSLGQPTSAGNGMPADGYGAMGGQAGLARRNYVGLVTSFGRNLI